jgi:hypothetical protein
VRLGAPNSAAVCRRRRISSCPGRERSHGTGSSAPAPDAEVRAASQPPWVIRVASARPPWPPPPAAVARARALRRPEGRIAPRAAAPAADADRPGARTKGSPGIRSQPASGSKAFAWQSAGTPSRHTRALPLGERTRAGRSDGGGRRPRRGRRRAPRAPASAPRQRERRCPPAGSGAERERISKSAAGERPGGDAGPLRTWSSPPVIADRWPWNRDAGRGPNCALQIAVALPLVRRPGRCALRRCVARWVFSRSTCRALRDVRVGKITELADRDRPARGEREVGARAPVDVPLGLGYPHAGELDA